MDKKILGFHIIQVMKGYNHSYEIHWNEEKMIWKNRDLQLSFSEKEVALFEHGRIHEDRYLHYILNNLATSEVILHQLNHVLTSIECHEKRFIPAEISYAFPKMACYSSAKKKIFLNPLKLEQYAVNIQADLDFTQEEIATYVFLHEYGHLLQDREINLSKKGKEQIARAKNWWDNESFLLKNVQTFIYEMEKDAWERGVRFLPLFPFGETAYRTFSSNMLASYENPSQGFLKERIRSYSP